MTNSNILPKISNVNYNLYIKEVGELAEINDSITKDTCKSGKAVSLKYVILLKL